MRSFLRVAILGFLVATTPARSERFFGILPGDTLSEVRVRLPNASIKDSKPAWLKSHERLVTVTGPGIDGTLWLRLEHQVDATRAVLHELLARKGSPGGLSDLEVRALDYIPERLERMKQNPPADPWEVKEIRWEPRSAVPYKYATTRYGDPSTIGVDEQFKRFASWEDRGITAYYGEGETIGLFIFTFTLGDLLCADLWRKDRDCDARRPFQRKN